MRRLFFYKLRVHIKDTNNSSHGKFHRFLFPFYSKFQHLNFAPICFYIYTNNEPVLPVVKTLYSPLNLYVFSCMNSTYLLTSEERRERERRERQRARINRPRASEEESCGKFMQHLETCLLVAEADRVLCHRLIF